MIFSLRKIINGDLHIKFYDADGVISFSLRNIPQKNFSSLPPLYVTTEDYDNIIEINSIR